MSGRKQHYIPQFLLRNFANESEKKPRTYIIRKEKGVSCSLVENIAATRDFYSSPSKSGKQLDGEITAREHWFAAQIRNLKNESDVDAEIAADLVAHLSIRTSAARDILNRIGKLVLSGVKQKFSNKDTIKGWFLSKDGDISQRFVNAIAMEYQECGLPTEVAYNFARVQLAQNFNEMIRNTIDTGKIIFEQLIEKIAESTRNAHVKVLSENVTPQERFNDLKRLNWSVISTCDNFILPDCVVIGFSKRMGVYCPYQLCQVGNSAAVMMPIHRKNLLIGIDDYNFNNMLNYNEIAIRCSNKFFISALCDDKLIANTGSLGCSIEQVINLMVSEQLDQINHLLEQ